MRKLIFTLLLVTAFTASYAKHFITDDEKLSVKGIAQVEIAKQKMYSGQIKEALSIFKEVLAESPKNSTVLYYAADCSYKLGDIETATKYLETGKITSNPKAETYYLLGVIYQANGKTDDALAEFATFKSKASAGEIKENNVDVNISQCNNAKKINGLSGKCYDRKFRTKNKF